MRNVALTAPYMHDGSLRTLQDAVAFYGKSGVDSTLLHPLIRQLRLTKDEGRELVDFMESLTSAKFADKKRLAMSANTVGAPSDK